MWGIFLNLMLLHLCYAQDPPRPYPPPDAYLSTTSILNHSAYINAFDDQQWFIDNIPFVDFPDKSIQDVYYYRTTVIKRHLKWAHEGHGWVFTEFIQPVGWASKFQTIPDSAAHQIIESRWLRNPDYANDVIQLYTRAGVEAISGITYTHYIHRAIFENAEATGDISFLTSQLAGMIKSFELWNVQFNEQTGLYHRTTTQDAQEYSLPGFATGGPNGGPVEVWNSWDNNYSIINAGPETYRPSMNAYMTAGAQAISEIALLAGNATLTLQWNGTASSLLSKMENILWNQDLQFWIDVVEGTNLQILGRELIGYFPYRFGIGTADNYIRGLEMGLTPEEFLTAYGPTTLEQTNPYYTAFKNFTYCCPFRVSSNAVQLWQGQSWPFSTCLYLDTLAGIARENRSTIVTPAFFQQALSTYTATNYKDGVPFTAEAHYPTNDQWSADTTNHSEHYLHSTYIDNIITGLIGVVPTMDDMLVLQPLVPDNWTYFAVENLPYHGSLFTILWDQTGSHYNTSNHTAGLSIYSNGSLLYNQPTLTPVNITLFNSTEAAATLAAQPRYENILANPNAPWGLPNISADYVFASNGDTSPYEAWRMIDGLMWYDRIPDNRWTNNQSTTPFDTIEINLPRPRTFNSVSLAMYVDIGSAPLFDGGVIACPEAIKISTRNGSVLAERNPWSSCVPNALNTILFDAPSTDPTNATTPSTGTNVTTDYLSIQVVNQLYYAVAISEIQIWVPANPGPRYEAEDGLLGTFIGSYEGRPSGLNDTIQDGGVLLGETGWAEIADVRTSNGQAGPTNLTVIGSGTGTLNVTMNFLTNTTVTFSGTANKTIEVEFLNGGNVVTMFQVSGMPFIDAIVVG